jgi:hypothetical protein
MSRNAGTAAMMFRRNVLPGKKFAMAVRPNPPPHIPYALCAAMLFVYTKFSIAVFLPVSSYAFTIVPS